MNLHIRLRHQIKYPPLKAKKIPFRGHFSVSAGRGHWIQGDFFLVIMTKKVCAAGRHANESLLLLHKEKGVAVR